MTFGERIQLTCTHPPRVVSVSYPQWCWREAGLEVDVTTGKQREMNFEQTGYSMQYTVSHDTTVVCVCNGVGGLALS